jgi:hypothetical protein
MRMCRQRYEEYLKQGIAPDLQIQIVTALCELKSIRSGASHASHTCSQLQKREVKVLLWRYRSRRWSSTRSEEVFGVAAPAVGP